VVMSMRSGVGYRHKEVVVEELGCHRMVAGDLARHRRLVGVEVGHHMTGWERSMIEKEVETGVEAVDVVADFDHRSHGFVVEVHGSYCSTNCRLADRT